MIFISYINLSLLSVEGKVEGLFTPAAPLTHGPEGAGEEWGGGGFPLHVSMRIRLLVSWSMMWSREPQGHGSTRSDLSGRLEQREGRQREEEKVMAWPSEMERRLIFVWRGSFSVRLVLTHRKKGLRVSRLQPGCY